MQEQETRIENLPADASVKPAPARKHINTAKSWNAYFDNDWEYEPLPTKMSIASDYKNMYEVDMYDVNDMNDTSEKLLEIWNASPYKEVYTNENGVIKKIPKKYVFEIFYYMKERLEKVKDVTALQCVLAINEFFDFSYDYIVQCVLSPKMMTEICQNIYDAGIHVSDMEEAKSLKLF